MQDLNKNDELLKEENAAENKLSKEDILSKSRNENKKGDEREKQITKNPSMVMMITLAICVAVVYFTELFLYETPRNELLAIMWWMLTVGYVYQYIKLKKKIHIAYIVIYGLNAVLTTVMWITVLCGI